MEDYLARAHTVTTREDIEALNLERERARDALVEYSHVERVIGEQTDDEGNLEYMIKCKLTSEIIKFSLNANYLLV